jgi:hypothetical protein
MPKRKNSQSFHNAVFEALHKSDTLLTSARWNRWETRLLTREWSNIVTGGKLERLKQTLLDLNEGDHVWIRLCLPTRFEIDKNRCFGRSSSLQPRVCKGKLDVVPRFNHLIPITPFGRCRNVKRLRVIFSTVVVVPLLHNISSIHSITSHKIKWKPFSNRIYSEAQTSDQQELVQGEESNLQFRFREIKHIWCFFDGEEWGGFSSRGQETSPRHCITGEVGGVLLAKETRRYSLLRNNTDMIVRISIYLWELICEYEMGDLAYLPTE